MKYKGFTLFELLAVIAIFSILIVIAVPSVIKIYKEAKVKTFLTQAQNIYSAAKKQYAADVIKNREVLIYSSLSENKLNLNNKNNNNLEYNIEFSNGKVISFFVSTEEYGIDLSGGIITIDSINKDNVIKGEIQIAFKDESGANIPQLVTGMIPIKYEGGKWVKADITQEWYNYDEKKWANAVLVKETGTNTRSFYQSKAAINQEVKEEDILAYFVWIPRYIYKITSGWNSNTTGSISIQFTRGIDDTMSNTVTLDNVTTASASNNKWTNHPAFWWDNNNNNIRESSEELKGIWVAKFEASTTNVENGASVGDGWCLNDNDNTTSKNVIIKPGVVSWRCLTPDTAFLVSRNMESNSIFGWNSNSIDTHLLKNVEWGAVVYLASSSYGKESSIDKNENTNYYTGGGNALAYKSNTSQSSTGNIYGIYDLKGGAEEHVSAYLANESGAIEAFGLSIYEADGKYKDVYEADASDEQYANYVLTANKKGDAIYETSNYSLGNGYNAWFNDFTYMPNGNFPWIMRDASFAFVPAFADKFSTDGFRPALVVGVGF